MHLARHARLLISLVASIAIPLGAISCRSGDRGASPDVRNADLSVRYVGGDACRRCHAAIAETYAGTGMARAFYPLDDAHVVEDFTSNNQVEIPSEWIR